MSYLNPGRTGLIGAPTYPMLRDATLTSLTEVLRENDIPFELNKSDFVMTLSETGSRILLRSLDEFERLRGTNLAWFGLDEMTYTAEEAWLRLEARLRDPKANKRCGFGVWTPHGFDWVYRKFIDQPVAGYEAILAKPFENRFLLAEVPDFYERLKSSYDENFYRQEALGDYLNSKSGLVYTSFARGEHLAQTEIDESQPLYWAVDFNVDPMSSVVAQMRRGDLFVVDEIVLRRATTEEACKEFEKRFGIPKTGVIVVGDASGAASQTTGFSDYGIIRNYFAARAAKVTYRVPKANPPVKERVNAMNGMLRTASGEVRLFVNPKCRELIADFEQVSYKDDSLDIDKNRDRRRTHLSDALGYLVWQEARAAGIGERGQRLV